MPPEDSPYGENFGRLMKFGEFGLGRAATTVDCAEAICDALESDTPRFRYPIGPDADDFWRAYTALNDDEEWRRVARLDNAAILNEAGVTISFTGTGSHDARKLRQVAGNAVSNGLPYEAGVAAMTVSPVVIFALGDDRGSIEENSVADLVIWSGDPLEVTSAADQVIIEGKRVDMVSRQTLLRERYLPQDPEMPRAYIRP